MPKPCSRSPRCPSRSAPPWSPIRSAPAWSSGTRPWCSYLPWFELNDPWITTHVTIGDMYAHRSGLPDHAGDDLEDLGYDRRQILQRLRFAPLHAFRNEYAYTNFGLTAAAEAVAAASGKDWATLSERGALQAARHELRPVRAMRDYAARDNRAFLHVRTAGGFEPKYQRQPDAQSPAGGVSSNARDLARWMAMVLDGGSYEGREIVAREALLPAITPQIVSSRAYAADARAGFYGYGFGVSVQPSGRVIAQPFRRLFARGRHQLRADSLGPCRHRGPDQRSAGRRGRNARHGIRRSRAVRQGDA